MTFTGRAPGAGPPEAVRGRFATAAWRVGERLVREAVWTEAGCTWPASARDGGPGAHVGGTLYGGTAGIGLFLAELAGVTADPTVARTATGAIRFALRDAAGLPDTQFGLHNGRVGIAYAAVRSGARLGEDFTGPARELLRPMAGRERHDTGLDVISGAAGAIPALLWMSDAVGSAPGREMALRLGEHLVAAAGRGPAGWWWGDSPGAVRGLCGYSHGASGMAHAFLELYHATGDGEYRHAAEQALGYEGRWFDAERGNWPDFRHREVSEQLSAGGPEALRARLRAGARLPPWKPSFLAAWCHGAPGIGLVRLRAFQVLGAPRYLAEARAALRTTLASLANEQASFSLCHGVAGNCELLLQGARVLDDPALWDRAAECALAGIRRYQDAGLDWPSGGAAGDRERGLMLGDAGVGMYLLRLADTGVDPVLLVTPSTPAAPGSGTGTRGYRQARAHEVRLHFGRTLACFAACGVDADDLVAPRGDDACGAVSDVEAAYRALSARIADEPRAELRARLQDAFLVDRERYRLAAAPDDRAQEYARQLARPATDEVDFEASRFRLAARVRVVTSAHDWDAWLASPQGALPSPEPRAHLLHAASGRVTAVPLEPLAARVLQSLASPASLAQVADELADELPNELDPARRAWLRDQVRAQLVQAYRMGLVEQASPEATDGFRGPPPPSAP